VGSQKYVAPGAPLLNTPVECKYVVPKAINISSLKGLGVYGVSVGYKYVVPSGTGVRVFMGHIGKFISLRK